MKIMNVKGTVDSLPSKEIIRRKVVNTLTDTFEKYGYLPLDTIKFSDSGKECIYQTITDLSELLKLKS